MILYARVLHFTSKDTIVDLFTIYLSAATKKEIFLLLDKASGVEGNMKNKVQRADRAESYLLVATNSHLELEADFVEKSVKIAELSTEMVIQPNINQITIKKMDRVKLDHTTVVGGFKECDVEFKKLYVFVSELERSSVSSLMLHEESSVVCCILKLVQKPKENNRQQYVELHEDVTSFPEVSSPRSYEHSIEMSNISVTESPNVLYTSLNGFFSEQDYFFWVS